MPRNGSGSYSLPEAAFVPNTAISSAAVNSDFSDIATALTGSLARDGQGGMTAVLPLANTGFVYSNDPNTGIRRTASDTQSISAGGVDVAEFTTTGASINGTLDVSGTLLSDGAPLLPIRFGPVPWSFLTAPPKWIFARGQTLLRADYPDFWTLIAADIAAGNTLYTNGNGSTTFTVPDFTGRIGAGKEAVATRLTSTYFGGNSTILGATGGLESTTLLTANLPPYTPAGTNTGGAAAFNYNTSSYAAGAANAIQQLLNVGGASTMTTNFTQPTFTGTAAPGQISTPIRTVQPTIIVNNIIYAGA